jgi:lipopolysaccharide export system protein LptA
MRWQKVARLAIAVFVIAFGAVVVVTLRQSNPPTAQAPPSPREDEKAIAETHATPGAPLPVYKRTGPDGKVLVSIAYEKQRTYQDGRTVFLNATATLPDRNGRTVDIAAGEMEVSVPQNEAAPVSSVRGSKGVKLTTSDQVEITGESATYDDRSGLLAIPGEVRFTKERMNGSGHGATYDRAQDLLTLLENARVNVAADEKGAGALEATAGTAALARAQHNIRLTRVAHVVSDGRTLDAEDITIQLTPDNRLMQVVLLRGNSRITGTPGSGGAEGMSARDIDLTYADDGRTLKQARLVENAVVRLAGEAGGSGKRVSGRTIDIGMGDDGTIVTSLSATQDVELELPATPGDSAARLINAASLNAGGATGLQTATFDGGVTFRETRPGARGAAPSERTGRSQRLTVETQPGLGAIQRADFRGNVRIVDGATIAEGQRAVYHIAQDRFDIANSNGDPGPPPSVNDGRVLVSAATISLTVGTRKLVAEGNVRSSLQPARRDDAGSSGKVPSMLKADEIVNVRAKKLEYDGASSYGVYTGDARLWQDKTTIKGDTITVDDRNGNLTSTGHVASVMFFEEVDSATKAKKLSQMDATGDRMVYEDAKRLATYTTGSTATARIIGTQGDVVADKIQLFLKQGANELERAEADGSVTVKEGGRTATGNHLTYTAADDTYLMTGNPLELEERTPTDCRVTVGATLSFKRAAVSTLIQNNGLTPNEIKPCASK